MTNRRPIFSKHFESTIFETSIWTKIKKAIAAVAGSLARIVRMPFERHRVTFDFGIRGTPILPFTKSIGVMGNPVFKVSKDLEITGTKSFDMMMLLLLDDEDEEDDQED